MSRGVIFTSSRGALILCLLTAAAGAARAADPVAWTVSEASGIAQQRSTAGNWVALAAGSVLAPGAQVRTGQDGKLALSHGKDRVTVSPGSEFSIPRGVDPATGPSLIERLGTILFRVEHRPDRHFEVDGPYLAAVVKGTVFTLNASALEDQVHVAEGAVQVTVPAAHRTALIRPGQTAVVTASGKSMSILGTPSPGKATRQRSDLDDPGKSETKQADAAPAEHEAEHGKGPRITRTLGDVPLDTAALSGGLLGGNNGEHGSRHTFKAASADASASDEAGHGRPDAGAEPSSLGANGLGNLNAGGGNAFAGAGNAGNAFAGLGNPGRGDAFAGTGNAGNPGGGNAFAGAGNAGNGNAFGALGIPNGNGNGNGNAHGGNPNAGGHGH